MSYLEQIDATRIYSNFGPLNSRFEQRLLSERFQGVGAISTVTNATLGLMLAIAAVRRPAARYAVMPSFTFAATPLAAMWCGLVPYFVDVDPQDLCMGQSQLEEAIGRLGSDLAVVVPYAAFGGWLDLGFYGALMGAGVPVVVDAAASMGTTGGPGQFQFGQGFPGFVVFSLHATKAFCIGEGGLIYSANERLVARTRKMMNFGFSSARASDDIGLNAKLSEYGAAIGLATLDVYDEKIARRQTLYEAYRSAFSRRKLLESGWEFPQLKGQIPHQFVSVLCPTGTRSGETVRTLSGRGIESRTYFSPSCHQQPQFASCPRGSLAVTEEVAARIVSLPLWEEMTPGVVDQIVGALPRASQST